MNTRLQSITQRIAERSQSSRAAYLALLGRMRTEAPQRANLPCANLAHALAGCTQPTDRQRLLQSPSVNVGIISAYNDILSAHQPYERYLSSIKETLRTVGAVGQMAGGVPAMCDGVTQGGWGMELSLASREVIALATAIALSHGLFDAVLCLGVCDKIVPGLLMGALRFGHLPALFIPAGPMASGISNQAKAKARQDFAEGRLDHAALLASELQSYHSPGTCTFYGTANTNQIVMEVMGLHLPGSSFIPANTDLRDRLTRRAAQQVVGLTTSSSNYTPLGNIVDEKSLVNAVVAVCATGGSTNHSLHLPAIAQAAGIRLTWQDMADISAVVPSLMRVYPNGSADINRFQAAGGVGFLIQTLLEAELLHEEVQTVMGFGLHRYCVTPHAEVDGPLVWHAVARSSADEQVLRPADRPFSPEGGWRLVTGNLGRAIAKISAVASDQQVVEAPARVFEDQAELVRAFELGELNQDVVVVMRFQGPQANGMPELHKLTPFLSLIQDRGHRVALVTDGRMSGASGKVLAAIHVTPEAAAGGLLARVMDGDWIRVDATYGQLSLHVEEVVWSARPLATPPKPAFGGGRELFTGMRAAFNSAEQGASIFSLLDEPS